MYQELFHLEDKINQEFQMMWEELDAVNYTLNLYMVDTDIYSEMIQSINDNLFELDKLKKKVVKLQQQMEYIGQNKFISQSTRTLKHIGKIIEIIRHTIEEMYKLVGEISD